MQGRIKYNGDNSNVPLVQFIQKMPESEPVSRLERIVVPRTYLFFASVKMRYVIPLKALPRR